MLNNPITFYAGLLDGAPAHLSFSKDSITLELFRDPRAAKLKFHAICRVQVDPSIKVISFERWEYLGLERKIETLQSQLDTLKMVQPVSVFQLIWLKAQKVSASMLRYFKPKAPKKNAPSDWL